MLKNIGIGFLFLLLASCSINGKYSPSSSPDPLANDYKTIPGLLQRGNSDNQKLIVFVHGLSGDSKETWLNQSASTYWPKMISHDPDFRNFDVYAVDFKTEVFRQGETLYEVSEIVSRRLHDLGFFKKYKEIHFITHSMGGLITKKILIDLSRSNLRDDLQRVKSVFLFATPSQGAELSSIANFLTFNRQIIDLKPANFNSYLQALEADWINLLRSKDRMTRIYCAYETLPTFGVLVVTRLYAATVCDQPPTPFISNHIDIVKPASPFDEKYIWVKARILYKNFNDDNANSKEFNMTEAQTKTDVSKKPVPPSLDGNFIIDFTNPTPQFPTGPIESLGGLKYNHVLKWVPSSSAEKYVVWIGHTTDGHISTVYNSADICKSDSNICETPPIILSQGEAHWAVRGIRGEFNSSTWSSISTLTNGFRNAETDYTPPSISGNFILNLLPPIPITSSDASSRDKLNIYSIKFVWSHVPESEGYVVWVKNSKQKEMLKFFKSSGICQPILGICETPPMELENRPWLWTVRAGSLDERHSSKWGPLVNFGYE